MFCGNIFTSTDLQNHKKNHMKKLQKRFLRVNRALSLSLSNAFEKQKFIPKISPCFPKIVCGGQCAAYLGLTGKDVLSPAYLGLRGQDVKI